MYQAIVKRLTLHIFDLVNAKKYDKVLASCTADVTHEFGGNHALGGKRYGTAALHRWFDRLGRLVPSLQLDVKEVWVKGFPWNTTVIARWVGNGTFPDGSPYENHGVHIVHIRWGKVTSLDANEDSQVVAKLMDALGATGVDEAGAAPLT
jgi:ketosteroid isomerase-like protein